MKAPKTMFIDKAEIQGTLIDLGRIKGKLNADILAMLNKEITYYGKDISFKAIWGIRDTGYVRLSFDNYVLSITLIKDQRYYTYTADEIKVDRNICAVRATYFSRLKDIPQPQEKRR